MTSRRTVTPETLANDAADRRIHMRWWHHLSKRTRDAVEAEVEIQFLNGVAGEQRLMELLRRISAEVTA